MTDIHKLAGQLAVGKLREEMDAALGPPDSIFRNPDDAPVQAGYAPTWNELARDCLALAERVREAPLTTVLAVLRGGAVPATIVAHALGVPDVRCCRLAGYDGRAQRGLQVLLPPDQGLLADRGAGVLVVDDLADTGATMEHLRALLPQAVCCAPYAKPRGEGALHLHARSVAQDVWIRFPWEASNDG